MLEPETENDDDPHDRVQNACFSNKFFPAVTLGFIDAPVQLAVLREMIP